jgi:hypothetical protein
MAASVLVSRELKSLQQELSAGLPEGPRGTARCNCGGPAETPDERELRDQFASELTHLFTDAEKGISTHPTQSPDASSACRRAISRSMAQPFISRVLERPVDGHPASRAALCRYADERRSHGDMQIAGATRQLTAGAPLQVSL